MQFGIAEAVGHWARYRPRSIAVQTRERAWAYADLDALATEVGAGIASRPDPDRRVALAIRSKVYLIGALLGVLKAGRSAVLLNTGLPASALQVNLREADVRLLVHDNVHSDLTGLVDSSVLAPTEVTPGACMPPGRLAEPADEWGVLFSSGTTGIPKGIERSHESMVTEFLGWCLELGLTRHSHFYIGRPVYYTGGLVLAMACLLVGGTVILNDYEHDDSFEEAWRDYQATASRQVVDFAFFIPDQLRQFLRMPASRPGVGARTILTMGGPITGTEKRELVSRLGSAIIESWGNTESLGTITDPEDVEGRADSIGRPFLTDEMSVVNEQLAAVGPFVIGRLAGGETAGFLQYCSRPEATRAVKRNELIISEDLGYVDADGYFYVKGRMQDCVVLEDGSTVFLQELEGELRRIALIADCCVVAVSGPNTAVDLCAAVTLSAGDVASVRGLLEAAGGQLARIKVIRSVGSLPRLPSGKLDRLAVQREFAAPD